MFKHYFVLAFLFEGPTMAKERKLLYFYFCVTSPAGIFSSTIELNMRFGEGKRRKGSQLEEVMTPVGYFAV